MKRYFPLFLCLFFLSASPAIAISLEPALPDAAQEERAQNLFKQIRCVVCTSESIHDSNAGLAKDLRQLVRERITAGDSDAQILARLVERYGDTILMEPPVKQTTYLLWYGPLVVLLLGGIGSAVIIVGRNKPL